MAYLVEILRELSDANLTLEDAISCFEEEDIWIKVDIDKWRLERRIQIATFIKGQIRECYTSLDGYRYLCYGMLYALENVKDKNKECIEMDEIYSATAEYFRKDVCEVGCDMDATVKEMWFNYECSFDEDDMMIDNLTERFIKVGMENID